MKKSPLLVGLALALILAMISVRRSSDSTLNGLGTDPGAGSSAEGMVDPAPESRWEKEAGHRPVGGAGVAAEDSLAMTPGLVARLAAAAEAVLPLPGGLALPLTVARRIRGEDGEVIAVEGTVSRPAAGRFMFRRQPEGALPGPLVGFVFYPTLDYGYRVETVTGRSRLVRTSVDDIACVQYGPPADLEEEEIPADHPIGIPIPGYQNGVLPLQSLPGAEGVIYLDFDGEEGPHDGWGDFDAVSHGSSNTQIFDVWRRVAEDFAPFDLNVTTDLQVYLDAAETSRQRCIISPTTDAAPGAGGVAYLNSFNWSGDVPCWAFYGKGKASAEVISHEIGHTLSLSHDGRVSPSEGYYGGHGSGTTGWAPIMGVGYYKELTQWSKGEYLSASQTQDDLLRITSNNNTVDYRVDDHGASHASSTTLGFSSSGQVDDEGAIETDGDVDAFVFTTTTGGTLSVDIDPVDLGANLDLSVELFDEANNSLDSSNPADALDASLVTVVAAGTYTIRVTNTGKGDPLDTGYTGYASLGQYTITGSIPGSVLPDHLQIDENSALGAVVGTVSPRNAHGANPLVWSITEGNGLGAFQIDPGTGEITVASPAVLDVEALSPGWTEPPVFDLRVAITDSVLPALNESIQVLITVLDVNEAPSITGTTLTLLEHTRVGLELFKFDASDPDRLDGLSYAITGGDPAGRFSVDAAGFLTIAGDLSYEEQSSYSLIVTVSDSGTPALTDAALVTVDLIDTVEGYVPGSVEHAFYRGIPGNNLSGLTGDPDFPACPDDVSERDSVHAQDDGDEYGRVVRGYLIPPSSGNYTFWIAGDDSSELFLSTDEDPGNSVLIAGFSGYTGYQQWAKFGAQQSVTIPAVGGQAYYFEARQKQGGGGDHLSLAWEIRDPANVLLVSREPIPGRFCAPHAFNYCPRLTNAAASIRDNVYPGVVLHQFDAMDLNSADSHSYAITAGDPQGRFSIDPVSGAVSLQDNNNLAASYNLTVTASDGGSPALMGAGELAVTVIAGDVVDATEPLMEFWDNLNGNSLGTLTASPLFPDRPERLTELSDLDSGENLSSDYGARIRAYLTPPTTGLYTFYLASDDQSSLLLSTDDDPGNATEIVFLSKWTGYLEWNKYPAEQTSAAISLTGGQRYFIEARLKEGGGGDHVAVGWTGPGIAAITLIDSSVLEPFDSNVAPALSPIDPAVDVAPGALAGTSVASFAAVDSPFESLTYAILGGNDGDVFAIDAESGEVSLADPAGLHAGPYELTVGVQDGGHGGYFPLRETTTKLTVHVDDLDRDELPDAWEIEQFGVLSNLGTGDADLDTFSNREEFVFGSIADLDASVPVGPKATGVGAPGAYRFEYRIRSDLAPGAYRLFASEDLNSWAPLDPEDYQIVSTVAVDASHDLVTVEVMLDGENCFLRAGAE